MLVGYVSRYLFLVMGLWLGCDWWLVGWLRDKKKQNGRRGIFNGMQVLHGCVDDIYV